MLGLLVAAGVLCAILASASPAFASRCSDAYADGVAAFEAAATVQSETRRLIRVSAAAARRLQVVDLEIQRRETARVAFEEAEKYCDTADHGDGPRASELHALIVRNERRLNDAYCQRLGFQARALIDHATVFQNTPAGERAQIREQFVTGYDKLKKGLKAGCPDAQKQLGIQLAKIRHHALTLSSKTAEVSGIDASHGEQFRSAMRHYKTREYRAAARQFQAAAEAGHPRAQYYLGRLHMEGWGVRKSDALALHWFKESAKQGDPAGQNSLGLMYDLGRGVTEDDATAVLWYERAAEQGLPFAQTNLGQMYEHGQGVPRDLVRAIQLYRFAADRGHVRAHYRLGRVYEHGLGVKKDLVTAITFYRRAADRGYKPALQALAALGG